MLYSCPSPVKSDKLFKSNKESCLDRKLLSLGRLDSTVFVRRYGYGLGEYTLHVTALGYSAWQRWSTDCGSAEKLLDPVTNYSHARDLPVQLSLDTFTSPTMLRLGLQRSAPQILRATRFQALQRWQSGTSYQPPAQQPSPGANRYVSLALLHETRIQDLALTSEIEDVLGHVRQTYCQNLSRRAMRLPILILGMAQARESG